MKFLRINAEQPGKELLLEAAGYIKEGKLIIYPTDTVYGLGCRIDLAESVDRIYELKERSTNAPLSVAFSDLDMLERYVILSDKEREFIVENAAEPFTFVVKKRGSISDLVTAGGENVGARIMNHPVSREIIRYANVPLITTSANISGDEAPRNVGEIDYKIKVGVDLIIDSGPCNIGVPSKVIEIETGKLLRG